MKKINLFKFLSRKLFVISLILLPLSSLAETTDSKSKAETSSWGKDIQQLANQGTIDSKPDSEVANSKTEVINERTQAINSKIADTNVQTDVVDSKSNKKGFFSSLFGKKDKTVPPTSNNKIEAKSEIKVAEKSETTDSTKIEVKSDIEVAEKSETTDSTKIEVKSDIEVAEKSETTDSTKIEAKSEIEVAEKSETTDSTKIEVKSDIEVAEKSETTDSTKIEVKSDTEVAEKSETTDSTKIEVKSDTAETEKTTDSQRAWDHRLKANETVENQSEEEIAKKEQIERIRGSLVSIKTNAIEADAPKEVAGIRINARDIIVLEPAEFKSSSVKVVVNTETGSEKIYKASFIDSILDNKFTLLQFKKDIPGSFVETANVTDINFKGKTPMSAYLSLKFSAPIYKEGVRPPYELIQGEISQLLKNKGEYWALKTSIHHSPHEITSGLYLTEEGKLIGLHMGKGSSGENLAMLIDHVEKQGSTGNFNIDKDLVEKEIPPALIKVGEELVEKAVNKDSVLEGFNLLKKAADLGDVRASAILMEKAVQGVYNNDSFENLKKDVLSKGQVPLLLEIGKKFYLGLEPNQAEQFFIRAGEIGKMSPGRPGMLAGMLIGIFHEKGIGSFQVDSAKAKEYYSQMLKGFIQPKLIEEFMFLERENFQSSFLNMYEFAKQSSLYTNNNSKHLLLNFLEQMKNLAIEMQLFSKQDFANTSINKDFFKRAEKIAKPGFLKRALYKCSQSMK